MDLFKLLTVGTFYNADNGEGEGGGGNPNPKLYTQDQLNGIVGSRLAEERSKIYKQFGVADDEELKTLFDNAKIFEKENTTLKEQHALYEAEKTKAVRSKTLLEKGIEPDLIDIALEKWDGDEAKMDEFLKANPKLTTAYYENKQFQGTGRTLGEKGGKLPNYNDMTMEEIMALDKKK